MDNKVLSEYLGAIKREVIALDKLKGNNYRYVQTLYTIIATMETDIRLNIKKEA